MARASGHGIHEVPKPAFLHNIYDLLSPIPYEGRGQNRRKSITTQTLRTLRGMARASGHGIREVQKPAFLHNIYDLLSPIPL